MDACAHMQTPEVFVQALRQFHEAKEAERGAVANAMADAIITKRVDLAAVRQLLLETGEHELMDTLNRLLDLIEPYLAEGGDTE